MGGFWCRGENNIHCPPWCRIQASYLQMRSTPRGSKVWQVICSVWEWQTLSSATMTAGNWPRCLEQTLWTVPCWMRPAVGQGSSLRTPPSRSNHASTASWPIFHLDVVQNPGALHCVLHLIMISSPKKGHVISCPQFWDHVLCKCREEADDLLPLISVLIPQVRLNNCWYGLCRRPTSPSRRSGSVHTCRNSCCWQRLIWSMQTPRLEDMSCTVLAPSW